MTTAKDKWDQELREGDLIGHKGWRRRIRIAMIDGERINDGAIIAYRPNGSTDIEILSRGLPTDPVPERFEPERDREGRPVLERSSQALVMQRPELAHVLHLFVDGVCACGSQLRRDDMVMGDGTVRSVAGELLGRATETIGGPPSLPPGVTAMPYPSEPKPQPDLHSRYVAFDARVREIVAEVAPLAPVVTDRVFGNEERDDGMLVSFKDGLIKELVFSLTHEVDTFAISFRYHLNTYLMAAGKRAMGGKR